MERFVLKCGCILTTDSDLLLGWVGSCDKHGSNGVDCTGDFEDMKKLAKEMFKAGYLRAGGDLLQLPTAWREFNQK